MEEKQQFWHIMFIISRKVKTQLKRKKKICAVYGEGAVTDQMRQKWFAKFHAGNFSLDDAPQSGRPVEVDSDQSRQYQGSSGQDGGIGRHTAPPRTTRRRTTI